MTTEKTPFLPLTGYVAPDPNTKRWEFVKDDTTRSKEGFLLKRIRALVDMPQHGVKAGDLGGYLEHENNLPLFSSGWVAGNAKVYRKAMVLAQARVEDLACVLDAAHIKGKAVIKGSARVYENAVVKDTALVSGYACVFGSARIEGRAKVLERSQVCGEACVSGAVYLMDDAYVSDYAFVCGEAHVKEQAILRDFARVSGKARIKGKARVCDYAVVRDSACITDVAVLEERCEIAGEARIGGDVRVSGDALVAGKLDWRGNSSISGNAVIQSESDLLTIGPFYSCGVNITAHRDAETGLHVSVPGYAGSFDDFRRMERKYFKQESDYELHRQVCGFIANYFSIE